MERERNSTRFRASAEAERPAGPPRNVRPLEANRLAIGYGAGLVAIVIWAAWIVGTRYAVADAYDVRLSPLDVALLRFAAPAVLFAPFWLRTGLKPRSVSWPVLIAMLGWGAPFALFAAVGMAKAPVSAAAALVPGMMPLWAALSAWLVFRQRLSAGGRLGLILIFIAAVAILWPALSLSATSAAHSDVLSGAPWLIAAAICWAVFAVAFKRSGLDPMTAAGLVGAYSVLMLLPLFFVLESNLSALSWESLIGQFLFHGVLSGAVSIAAYAMAIDRLGAQRAASLSALVPVLAVVFGMAFLGEALTLIDGVAIGCASLGVALVNGVFSRRAIHGSRP